MAAVIARQQEQSTLWVKEVPSFSSEYMDTSWSARNIIGPSRVYPKYGDNPGTWTHLTQGSTSEFLQVVFEEKIFIQEINFYETYNGGAVVKIELKAPGGNWVEVYSTQQPTRIETSRIFSPSIEETNFRSNEMKITIDASSSGDWYELDAVQIKGTTYKGAPAPPLEELSRDLRSMVNNAEFSDVTFVVDEQTIYGHKVVLAARCPYFRGKFKSGQTKDIIIKDVSHNIFLALLEFLYTNNVDVSVPLDVLTGLLRFARQQSLESLGSFCDQRIFQAVTSDNVVKVYRNASENRPVLESVKTVCLEYISSHMDSVCRTEDFKQLPQQVMLDIVQQTVGQSR